jgi:hypothetical protein
VLSERRQVQSQKNTREGGAPPGTPLPRPALDDPTSGKAKGEGWGWVGALTWRSISIVSCRGFLWRLVPLFGQPSDMSSPRLCNQSCESESA